MEAVITLDSHLRAAAADYPRITQRLPLQGKASLQVAHSPLRLEERRTTGGVHAREARVHTACVATVDESLAEVEHVDRAMPHLQFVAQKLDSLVGVCAGRERAILDKDGHQG